VLAARNAEAAPRGFEPLVGQIAACPVVRLLRGLHQASMHMSGGMDGHHLTGHAQALAGAFALCAQ